MLGREEEAMCCIDGTIPTKKIKKSKISDFRHPTQFLAYEASKVL